MLNLTSLIFIVNNFYCVINCLNINRITISRAKCLDLVTLKILPQLISSLLRGNKLNILNSENEAKQNRYEFPSANSIIKCLGDFENMTGFCESFCPFFSKSLQT